MKKMMIAGVIIFVVLLLSGFFYFKPSKNSQPVQLYGEESLTIIVLDSMNNPVKNLEVDLWTSTSPSGPPSAGFLMTDEMGKVKFMIPEGDYLIGFNQIGFPEEFLYPKKISVVVNVGNNEKEIILGDSGEKNSLPGEWKEKGVAISGKYADADVVDLGDGTYRMYYTSEPEVANFNGQVYSSVSSDGINWKEESGTRKEWSTFPSVIKTDSGYRMYFQTAGEIKSAVSSDGLTWKDESGVRISKDGNANLNLDNVAAPTVIKYDNKYIMVYRGTINEKYASDVPNSDTQLFFWASSNDGINFEKKGIALDSRNDEFNGLLDGGEFIILNGKPELYFWSYNGVYHSEFTGSSFGESIFDFMTSDQSSPPGDPTLEEINGKLFMYYGQHTKGIYYAVYE